MTMQFKDTYREWNEKVRPSEELLSRLLTEASKVTEASEISVAEESAKRHKSGMTRCRKTRYRVSRTITDDGAEGLLGQQDFCLS